MARVDHQTQDHLACEIESVQNFFSKRFNDETYADGDGYPCYMRKDSGVTVIKSGTELDNKNVVPYNPSLILKYNVHINVELCNQSRAIKYLFMYINKGQDRITAGLSRARGKTKMVRTLMKFKNTIIVDMC